jgi:FMN phosphatase YigB (HAD superfamily)
MTQKNLPTPSNRSLRSGKDVLIFDLDDTLYERCGRVGDQGENLEEAQLSPGVRELLSNPKFTKILVSKELVPGLQQKKILHLGLSALFDEIFICSSDPEKKVYFQEIKENFPEEKIWVIGDRIDSEIRWGNELNLNTVQICQGKYKDLKPKDYLEIPKHKIVKFIQLREIIK